MEPIYIGLSIEYNIYLHAGTMKMDWTSPKDVTERRVLVTETIFDDDPIRDGKRFYVFPLGVPVGAEYRQVVSYNAFFHSRSKRRNWTNKRLFYPTVVGVDPIPPYPISEPIVCVDIYAFYEAIEYDYKKGKYLNGERMIPTKRRNVVSG